MHTFCSDHFWADALVGVCVNDLRAVDAALGFQTALNKKGKMRHREGERQPKNYMP